MTWDWLKTTIGIFATGLALGAGSLPSVAQDDYPNRPITIVYPYSAGSATEVVARQITEEAAKILGQPILFENKPGALGRLGILELKEKAPDGYYLNWTSEALLITHPLADEAFEFALDTDYETVALPIRSTLLLYARGGLPYATLPEMLEYAKANPGAINFAHAGAGTASHLLAEAIADAAGVRFTLVPYAGTAPAMTDLLGGHVDLLAMTTGGIQYVETGELVGLATGLGAERWYIFPEVPSFIEDGLDVISVSAFGVTAPAETPEAIIDTLNAAFNAALDVPAVQESLKAGGYVLDAKSTPEEYDAFIQSEIERVGPILEKTGLRLD